MPELPEVEAARRLLETHQGRRFHTIRVLDPTVVKARASTRPDAAEVGGAQRLEALSGVAGPAQRHGKRLAWTLAGQGLILHLGMTGRFILGEPTKHTRWSVHFDNAHLHFDDPRRFGQLSRVVHVEQELTANLGPDALGLTATSLRAHLGRTGRLKQALLDQKRIAGVGNIHAAEACWRAGLHPARPLNSLDASSWSDLNDALAAQLTEAIAALDPARLIYYQDGGDAEFAVYDRAGKPCLRCGVAITRSVTSGRSTYACPGCQH